MPDISISRRHMIGLTAAALTAAEPSTAAPAPPADAAQAGNAALSARARDFVRMRGSLDERLVIGFLSGQYYGVVDDEITPMFGVLSATFSRWRALPEGGYWVASFEHSYYTDSDSGAVLASWRNPFNGRSGSVPVWTSEPARRILTPELSFRSLRAPPPHVSLEQRLVSAEDRVDEVVLVERVRFVSKPPPPGRPYRYSEIVTLRASTAALADPSTPRVPCTTSFVGLSSWRPWQQMDDQTGHLLAHGSGRYGADLEALPKVWLEATGRLRPDLLKDPGRMLDAAFRA